jgi:glycosyltransferase involved in cell wall biosynthesis
MEQAMETAIVCLEPGKMNKLPLVTIGFMTYNHFKSGLGEAFFKAIESLISQDYPNKEILIIDDCSTDETYHHCVDYANRYPVIKLFRNEKNFGPTRNFENLLEKISGEFFLWACPDDAYASNFVSECVSKFNENGKAITVTTALRINYDNGNVWHHHYHDFLRRLPLRKIVRNVLRGRDSLGNQVHYPPVIHASLTKTKYITYLYCRDEFYGFEEAWFLNALVWGEIDYIDKVLYYRYDNSIPYQMKNPEIGVKFSDKWYFIKAGVGHLKYFMCHKGIFFNKKLRYFPLFLIFVWYRVIPDFIKRVKINLFEGFQNLKNIYRSAN